MSKGGPLGIMSLPELKSALQASKVMEQVLVYVKDLQKEWAFPVVGMLGPNSTTYQGNAKKIFPLSLEKIQKNIAI